MRIAALFALLMDSTAARASSSGTPAILKALYISNSMLFPFGRRQSGMPS
jgi:hypothetical protein